MNKLREDLIEDTAWEVEKADHQQVQEDNFLEEQERAQEYAD